MSRSDIRTQRGDLEFWIDRLDSELSDKRYELSRVRDETSSYSIYYDEDELTDIETELKERISYLEKSIEKQQAQLENISDHEYELELGLIEILDKVRFSDRIRRLISSYNYVGVDNCLDETYVSESELYEVISEIEGFQDAILTYLNNHTLSNDFLIFRANNVLKDLASDAEIFHDILNNLETAYDEGDENCEHDFLSRGFFSDISIEDREDKERIDDDLPF